MSTHTRDQWSSKVAFVLATTGAAVGLGNIWKFPYMAGNDGGSSFFLLYLICILLIGLPIMISELILGKSGQGGPVNTFQKIANASQASDKWIYLGWWSATTLILAFSFYSVVASWGFAYIFYAWEGYFDHQNAYHIHNLWKNFLAQPEVMLFWDTIFIIMTGYIVAKGVTKGLERAAFVLMPFLLLLLLFLAIYSTQVGDFTKCWHFLFDFNFQLSFNVLIDALGHAFFSLAVGACCILVYGSYLPVHMPWGRAISYIVMLDIIVAVLSGLAIFPLVFKNNISPQAGPGLMFEVLPIAFSTMPGGAGIGSLFFILLIFAAWSSSISLAEPLVSLMTERWGIRRNLATISVCSGAWLLSLGSMLSFNLWQHLKVFGRWDIFTTVTGLTTNIMLPLGGLFIAIFAGWVMDSQLSKAEFMPNKAWLFYTWRFIVRYITPLGIGLVLLSPFIR